MSYKSGPLAVRPISCSPFPSLFSVVFHKSSARIISSNLNFKAVVQVFYFLTTFTRVKMTGLPENTDTPLDRWFPTTSTLTGAKVSVVNCDSILFLFLFLSFFLSLLLLLYLYNKFTWISK
jgi:hypothetical protein